MKIAVIVAFVFVATVLVGLRFKDSSNLDQQGIKPIAHYSTVDGGDDAVLQQLRAHGSDLTKRTDIVNYLYIPKLADAERIREHLSRSGYQVEVREPLGRLPDGTTESRYSVLLHLTEVPSKENVRKMRRVMTELATRFHGEYDGWEAQVQP